MERIICSDNLTALKGLADNSVDLCYIDPPFFTSKTYSVIWGDNSEIRQFDDSFGDKDSGGRMHKDIQKYLDWMEPRLKEIYRVLKPTGSFYLHCDWHADAYLRVMCDGIFEREPNSVIVWKRTNGGKAQAETFAYITDTILYYSKSDTFNFHKQFQQYTEEQLKKFNKKDEKGVYYLRALNARGQQAYEGRKITTYKGCTGMWVNSIETIQELDKEGEIVLGENMIYKKQRPQEGVPIPNIWDDISLVGGNESFGYPTQKPEALLERIIQASSNEGDIVLDAFCGCGTALAVAKRLKRQYIGVDISPTACRLVAWRLNGYLKDKGKEWNEMAYKEFNAASYVEGLPLTPEEIAGLTGFEFQNWITRELGANPGKAGADGGIDGMLNGVPIQVKKYKAGRNDLDSFIGTLVRKNSKEGIFIALDFPTTIPQEIRRLEKENGYKITAWTFKDILDGKAKKHDGLP